MNREQPRQSWTAAAQYAVILVFIFVTLHNPSILTFHRFTGSGENITKHLQPPRSLIAPTLQEQIENGTAKLQTIEENVLEWFPDVRDYVTEAEYRQLTDGRAQVYIRNAIASAANRRKNALLNPQNEDDRKEAARWLRIRAAETK